VDDLKTTIARGEYEVDSSQVADEILAKLAIVGRVRSQLLPVTPRGTTGGFTVRGAEQHRVH
jgi:hypothetical protein